MSVCNSYAVWLNYPSHHLTEVHRLVALFLSPHTSGMSKKILPKSKVGTAVAALSIQIADRTGKVIQLLPAGRFSSVDGRPASMAACAEWVLDAANAQELIAAAAARGNPAVIDYEHQTLMKDKNGQPAPAAGWFKTLEWREGVGLFAIDVEWTPAAAQQILDGEYKFISPVIRFAPDTGRVTGLMMAALTNYAGIDGMQQATLAAMSSHFFNDEALDPHPLEDAPMNALLAALLKTLGLDDKADEATAIAALNAFVAKASANADAATALAANIEANGAPDPTKFVPIAAVTAMQTQLSALSNQVNGDAVTKVINEARAAGKVVPAMEAHLHAMGMRDLAALTQFIGTLPAMAALTGTQTQGKPPVDVNAALSSEQSAVCKALGLAEADYKKSLTAA